MVCNVDGRPLDRTVTTPASTSLNSVECSPKPVLEQVRNVADRVTMGQEIPTASTVAVVVEPRAEDEVRCGAEKDPDYVSIMSWAFEVAKSTGEALTGEQTT